MSASKVYFTDMSTSMKESLPDKLGRLIDAAGIGDIDFKDKFVAIKIHFGERGNLAYLRHNYARMLVDKIKKLGGKPFLTDSNTLYVGSRTNSLDHLDCARDNGYCYSTLGCNVIIADGLKGNDEILVPLNGECVKEAKIGAAIMDADIVISLTHFKCHESAGIGGALKNLGMGSGSHAGKMEMHYSGKPRVKTEMCVGCGRCAKSCGQNAIELENGKARITERCAGCGRCIGQCALHAIVPTDGTSTDQLNKRMAEYTLAVVQGRPNFHISLVVDVSPYCDCYSVNDLPIIPDVGMFASFDPVAIDKACADTVNLQRPLSGSMLDRASREDCDDCFHAIAPGSNWLGCLQHAEKLGVGTLDYELVTIK